jgi:hypothetical protein
MVQFPQMFPQTFLLKTSQFLAKISHTGQIILFFSNFSLKTPKDFFAPTKRGQIWPDLMGHLNREKYIKLFLVIFFFLNKQN